jgi:hypothetical protein
MRPTWQASATLIAAGVMVGGCASAPVRTDARPAAEAVQVVVQNDAPSDVVVFAYRGGQRVRIGFATSHTRSLVTVPVSLLAPGRVQLLLHPIGGGADFLADAVTMRAGEDHAELHVARELDESSMSVVPGRLRP